MNEKELKITMSSLLHDIGKVIYREGGDVRRHSLSGYDYLKDEAGITEKIFLWASNTIMLRILKVHH